MEKAFKYLFVIAFSSFLITFIAFSKELVGLTNYGLGLFLSCFGLCFIIGALNTYKKKINIYVSGPLVNNTINSNNKYHKVILSFFVLVGVTILSVGIWFFVSKTITGQYFLSK